jgi:uncharacterized protein YcbX
MKTQPILIGRVQSTFRYPVKSMAGERLNAIDVDTLGVRGDRVWAVRDVEKGEITSAKRMPAFLRCAARLQGGADYNTEITLPSGAMVRTDDEGASEALSRELGLPLLIQRKEPASNGRHYRVARLRTPSQTRRLLGVRPGGPLPDMSSFPLPLLIKLAMYVTPPGAYYDAYPIHLITTASVASLSKAIGAPIEIERFRPSLVIETDRDDVEYPELQWLGARILIGDTVLRIAAGTFRCGMPAHPQWGAIAKAPAVVKTIYDQLGSVFGVYATVQRVGRVLVGDPVLLVPASPSRARAAFARMSVGIKRRLLTLFLGLGRR